MTMKSKKEQSIQLALTSFSVVDSSNLLCPSTPLSDFLSGHLMRQKGRDKGSSYLTYLNAAWFFKKRELQGFKPPRKRATIAEDKTKYDVSSVTLPGEEDLKVPVYDTCDEVRRKIRNHMRDPMVTQAGFIRDIAKAAYPNGEKKPSSKTMHDFLGKKGRMAGNTSGVFYAAYVFFEKLRVRDEKSKTQFREEMEKAWGRDGVDIVRGSHLGVLCTADRRPVEDEYGRLRAVPISHLRR